MASLMRSTPSALRASSRALTATRAVSQSFLQTRLRHDVHNPPTGNFPVANRGPPEAPKEETIALKDNLKSGAYLGTTKRLPEFSLHDKVVLVTGAARGLGLVQAEALLEAGATVYALDRLPEPSPDFYRVQRRAAEELGKSLLLSPRCHIDHDGDTARDGKKDSEEALRGWLGRNSASSSVGRSNTLHYRQIDVRDVAGLNEIVRAISDEQGRLDGLIAAAGIQQETSALDYTAKDANLMFEVNCTGVFMTAQAVAKEMIRWGNGGSIAMIASMSGTVANRGLICPAYNASKAGVIQLGRNLAAEWGHYGIRVNTISPGYIVTQMVEALFEQFPERRRDWPTQNMLGKLSLPEEYRGAAVFLISDASSFMTGSDLRIDGGHCAW